MNVDEAKEIAIGLSEPSKMPCCSYSIPIKYCHTGGKLRKVEGSVCWGCYAGKGWYRSGHVQSALERRYEALVHPRWVEAMVVLIRKRNKGDKKYFRWHDSGDLQNEQHLANICEIAKQLPDIKFWLPTKEFKLVKDYFAKQEVPANLTVRLSMPKVDQAAPPVDPTSPFQYSEVRTVGESCPAIGQDHKCLDCRACWDKSNWSVAYAAH